jgi:hypothetical protein
MVSLHYHKSITLTRIPHVWLHVGVKTIDISLLPDYSIKEVGSLHCLRIPLMNLQLPQVVNYSPTLGKWLSIERCKEVNVYWLTLHLYSKLELKVDPMLSVLLCYRIAEDSSDRIIFGLLHHSSREIDWVSKNGVLPSSSSGTNYPSKHHSCRDTNRNTTIDSMQLLQHSLTTQYSASCIILVRDGM